jgi:hypothetical protein
MSRNVLLDNGKIRLQLLSIKKYQSKLKTKTHNKKNKLITGLKLKCKTIGTSTGVAMGGSSQGEVSIIMWREFSMIWACNGSRLTLAYSILREI